MTVCLKQVFDSKWYLSQYQDVANDGIDAWHHYWNFGRFEGRWPAPFTAVQVSDLLWRDETRLEQMTALCCCREGDPLSVSNAQLACWLTAQWLAANHQWQRVIELLSPLEKPNELLWLKALVPHQGPYLCLFEALLNTKQQQRAVALLSIKDWPTATVLAKNDHLLASSMVLSGSERMQTLNQVFSTAQLGQLNADAGVDLDDLNATGAIAKRPVWRGRPKVSVIVPCYNCAETLATAVNSLLAQSWQRLQIVLVNDGSSDDTATIMSRFASADARVTVVHLAQNEGAYGARNAGLDVCDGKFITTHDADDWSHPDKIACQVNDLLENPQLIANRSAWVRCSTGMRFSRWRPESSWIHPNVSSLMVRRRAFKRLGYWDNVSADGDTEFYYRLLAEYGAQAVGDVLPAVPLAFGRHSDDSLTQTGATHIGTMIAGVRADYQNAASAWHQSSSRYLERYPNKRPFRAPLLLCRGSAAAVEDNQYRHLLDTPLFSESYYLSRYADVAEAGQDAIRHYLRFGAAEGRDPSSRLSSSGYAYQHALAAPQNPLVECLKRLEAGETIDVVTNVTDGRLPDDARPIIMVVAHSTTAGAFGAERSLLDVLIMLRERFRLWLVLPNALNHDYVAQLQQHTDVVSILPVRWWHAERADDKAIIARLAQWLQQVDLLYVNTLTQHEPLIAARQAGVPSVVHVRELPEHDDHLCSVLGSPADAIRAHTLSLADRLIANSLTVSRFLDAPERTAVIPNTIALTHYRQADTNAEAGVLKVGMLSSNLAKKGVRDFFQIAQLLKGEEAVTWHLYGPITADLERVQADYPDTNVAVHGYVDDPIDALAMLDVVVNLSHFQESFGRTVLEAQAAGKVVLAYDWGALAELLHGDAGVLVEKGNYREVAHQVLLLANDKTRYRALKKNAFNRAAEYDYAAVKPRLVQQLEAQIDDARSELSGR